MCAPPMVGRSDMSAALGKCTGHLLIGWNHIRSVREGESGQGMLIDEVSSSIAEHRDRECVAAHHQEEEGDALRFLKPSRWLSSPCSRSSL